MFNPKPTYDDLESKEKLFLSDQWHFRAPCICLISDSWHMKFPRKQWKQIALNSNTEIFFHTHEARAYRFVITFMLHTIVLTLSIVNRTIYFIANRSQTVTNSDTKGSHSFITTKTPNYVCFFRLDDRKPINQYKRQT